MAESGGNGPRDPLTRFLPHNIQEPRPSIKPALLPSQPCVALNFPSTACRLDSSVITIKTDELSTAQGPVRRQDPLGKKAAHLIKPGLALCCQGGCLVPHAAANSSPSFSYPKKRGGDPLPSCNPTAQCGDLCHSTSLGDACISHCLIPPMPRCARSPLIPNFSGITTALALLFAAEAQKATGKPHFTAGSSTSAAGNCSCMGWEGHTTNPGHG